MALCLDLIALFKNYLHCSETHFNIHRVGEERHQVEKKQLRLSDPAAA